MKKLLSILICVILVCSIGSITASAATNYCELFQQSIRQLRWSMDLNGHDSAAEGKSFPVEVIMDYIKMRTMYNYVEQGEEYAYIPATVFETDAKNCFAIVDVNAMQSFEEEYWNYTTEKNEKRQVYDATKKAYVFIAAGGVGDSTTYVIKGYVKNGAKYTVYSHFVDLAGDEIGANEVEGKDYIVQDGTKCKIIHTLKNVVETDGKNVKFHSWEKVSSAPEVSGLITPSTKLEDEKPAESKPQSGTVSSKPQSTTSSQTSSDVSSSEEPSSAPEETKPLVTVAKTETAKLETEENVFPENTVVKVEEIKETKTVETIKEALKEVSEKFVAYEITAECKNVSVQPNGKVKATFNIPDGYDLDKVAVFYVADDGKTEKLTSSVDKGSKTVVAELSHFSTYVVAETNTVETNEDTEIPTTGADENGKKNSGALIWIIVSVVVVLGAGVACFFIFKNKKA